ncbi:MAG: hypothetical protein EOO60_00830 [Hymenobacter sp.]|nr:MAG: hypothetical protein EOO60_00830 [Hymenobacter sp.]
MLKYLALALLLATTAQPARAQTTSAGSGTTGKYQYCTLAGVIGGSRGARLDYGQSAKAASANPTMEALNKQVQELGSPVLALNYLLNNGWEYVGVTSLSPYDIIYVLRKRSQ